MASKTLNTRIKNRFDSLSAWQAEGVELLKGEIALVSVTTQQKDANGNIVNVPAVLMKVGATYTEAEATAAGNAALKDTPKPFSALPWLSAKAADVYDWAKVQYAANIPVTFNEDGSTKETLNDYLVKVNSTSAEVAAIKTAMSGGVHFIGITTTELADGSTTDTIKINGNDYTANNGDVVIYKANATSAEDEEKEFIWVKPAEDAVGHWEVLGDLSRVGALEDLLSALPESARTANQYVTHIVNENGKLVAKKAQPAASEVSYGDTTVEAKIGAIDAAIAEKADKEHPHDEYVNQNAFSNIKVGDTTVAADSATDTVEFAGTNVTITADADNDKITFAVASGTVDEAGIVKLYAGVDKADDTLAATAGAVKTAYDKAAAAEAAAASAATDIAANYVAVDENKNLVHIQKTGESTVIDTIIFDCGGASTNI